MIPDLSRDQITYLIYQFIFSRRGGSSYESNRRGSSYENYSREGAREDLMMELRELEQSAGDEETKQMVKKWIRQLEQD